MKNLALYTRRIKRLFSQLRKEGGHPKLAPIPDPMTCLLHGILSNYASDSRATSGLARLQSAIVDLNELRVSSLAEIVEIIGADYPTCRAAAEEITRTLQSIYNRLHHLDLGFLAKGSKKTAETFLRSLDGLSPHGRGVVLLRCLKVPVIPIDVHMHAHLRRDGCIPPDLDIEGTQRFVSHEAPAREAASLYVLLKRYATAHAPRKPEPRIVGPVAAPASANPVEPRPGAADQGLKSAVHAASRTGKAPSKARPATSRKPAVRRR
jgi:endonuclease III